MPVSMNMPTKNHLSFTYFQSLIKNELTQSQILERASHLKECDRCRELSDVLTYARGIAARRIKGEAHLHPKKADMAESIEKLLVEESSPQEAALLLTHLGSCSRCFRYLESFFEEAFRPLDEKMAEELKMYDGISIAKQALALRPPIAGFDLMAFLKKVAKYVTSRLGRAIRWIEENIPYPKVAYAFLFIAVIGGITVWRVYQNQNSYLSSFVYDDKVPYEYSESGFRTPSDEAEQDAQLQAFVNQFKMAMSRYLVRDYQAAIATLEPLEPLTLAVRAKFKNKESLSYTRDLYFYHGVSYLALARSQKLDMNKKTRSQYADAASSYLTKADSLVTTHNLENGDRETYFLGLAHGLGGQPDLAVAELKKITPTSLYYQDSARLIKQWSR